MNNPTSPRQRILIYAQHLSGVGHYVRTFEIARELAPHHDVYWIEGGRPVPHAACPELHRIELPRIRRGPDGRIQGLDAESSPEALMAQRAAILQGQVESIRPHVFLVEYFPFSKWELAGELLPAIESARRGGARVLCSLRDVVRKTSFERASAGDYAETVCDRVNRWFDAVLVHGDPALSRFEEHFEKAADIEPPVHHTGLVSEKLQPSPATAEQIAAMTNARPFALASAGGGAGGQRLIEQVIEAWRTPGIAGGRLLVICLGLGWPSGLVKALTRRSAGHDIVLLPFRADFLHWLKAADLSISQCGYNTVANLLETRTPAVVAPNPHMSDQFFRAQRLAEHGLVDVLDFQSQRPAGLAAAVERAFNRPRPTHKINLDGAAQTCQLIDALA